VRFDRTDEWEAELHEILRGIDAYPITRLVRGTGYAFGLLRASFSVGAELIDAGAATISASLAGVGLDDQFQGFSGRTL
jgi:hypothetical protein